MTLPTPRPDTHEFPINRIITTAGTQPRAQLHAATVIQYTQDLHDADGQWPFPPLVLYHDGQNHYLADGFHRLQAAKNANRKSILATIHQGTTRDAILHAAGANAHHGLRRTDDDKRRAVTRLLKDQEWGKWSDREIARACHVSPTFVGKLRSESTVHVDSAESSADDTRTYTRAGQTQTMQTANIGRKPDPLQTRLQRHEAAQGRTPILPQDILPHVQTYIQNYKDHHDRTFSNLDNPAHTNSVFWTDITRHFRAQNIPYSEAGLKHVIKQLHAQDAAPLAAKIAQAQSTNQPGYTPTFAPISELETLIRDWLIHVRTGGRTLSVHHDIIESAKKGGKKGTEFIAIANWLNGRNVFRINDLWQAVNNVHDQLTQQLRQWQQTAEAQEQAAIPFKVGDRVSIIGGGWQGRTGMIKSATPFTAMVEVNGEVSYPHKPSEIRPVSASLALDWLAHPTSRTAPATPELYLGTPAFPTPCPIGRAEPVNGANCGGCFHYRNTSRGTYQCEEPTWLETQGVLNREQTAESEPLGPAPAETEGDPPAPSAPQIDPRLLTLQSIKSQIAGLKVAANQDTEGRFIYYLDRVYLFIDDAMDQLKNS